MKTVMRYQSQLLLRRSYKPNRIQRFYLSSKPQVSFRPQRGLGDSRSGVMVSSQLHGAEVNEASDQAASRSSYPQ